MGRPPVMATATKQKLEKPEKKERASKDGEKKERAPRVRVNFLDVVDKNALNSSGKLTRVPSIGDEFLPKDMDRLDRDAFASEDLFLDHQANVFQLRGEGLLARSKRLRNEAENTRKFGDPEKRKKMKRAARLKDQLALLMSQLKAEGVEIDDLDSDESDNDDEE